MSVCHKFRAIAFQKTDEARSNGVAWRSIFSWTGPTPTYASLKQPLEGCFLAVEKIIGPNYSHCIKQPEEYSNWRTFKDPFKPGAFVRHGLYVPDEEEDGEGQASAVGIVATSAVPIENPKKVSSTDNIPKSCSVATYTANEPCEDRYKVELMEDGSLFAGVFDGHGGWQAAEYAQRRLAAAVRAELGHANPAGDADDQAEKALRRAFGRVEREFVYLIKQAFEAGVGAVSRIGACALVALRRGDALYVANAGDCRAVLGRRGRYKGAGPERWEALPLSADHNVREPAEQLKLRRWHPAEEKVFVCKAPGVCYVKGCLQPTRGFGDAYLKYPEFNGPAYGARPDGGPDRSRGRHIPPPYTPPYITAAPEVVTRRVEPGDRFLILATDGLWDFLSNEEAVEVAAAALAREDAAAAAAAAPPEQEQEQPGAGGGEGRAAAAASEGAAAALVAAALAKAAAAAGLAGGAGGELAALPAGRARRRVHDDTTVVVVRLR